MLCTRKGLKTKQTLLISHSITRPGAEQGQAELGAARCWKATWCVKCCPLIPCIFSELTKFTPCQGTGLWQGGELRMQHQQHMPVGQR